MCEQTQEHEKRAQLWQNGVESDEPDKQTTKNGQNASKPQTAALTDEKAARLHEAKLRGQGLHFAFQGHSLQHNRETMRYEKRTGKRTFAVDSARRLCSLMCCATDLTRDNAETQMDQMTQK